MSTRLHIGNFPITTTVEDIQQLFGRFGSVESAGINKDPVTGASKGFGFVEMSIENDADTAIRRLNFSQFGGRTIGVSRARTSA
jgi:cold-inducible RNA-binding protein